MLWPEARRSPSVGIPGATLAPSADTHAISASRVRALPADMALPAVGPDIPAIPAIDRKPDLYPGTRSAEFAPS
jgi:hypothetical protein